MVTRAFRESIVVLLSGGVDSCVLAHLYTAAGLNLHALSFNYGQRQPKELDSASRCIDQLRKRYCAGSDPLVIAHHVIEWPLSQVNVGDNSVLMNKSIQVPYGQATYESMRATHVAYCNPNMLLQAAMLAVGEKARLVAYGARRRDAAQYPDCREEFVDAFTSMLRASVDEGAVTIVAPFLHFTKAQIVRLGASLGVPFEWTWSCYASGEEGRHCGRCTACVERYTAFKEALVPDSTAYTYDPEEYLNVGPTKALQPLA